mmetsp:Transcript_55046/g.152567  ORF Transcript_55046/g.152567 Transcript_55046/m.152567 type:complete len:195 (-) Transcript_55046:156-740(-)
MLQMLHTELVPTEYALRMRPPFMGVLLVLAAIVIGKFVIRDLWGAISLLFVVLVGVFVLLGQYQVNASSALFFCVMAIISGVFDFVSCILYFQHSKYHVFHPKAPWIVLLAQAIFLLSPVILVASAALSYSIFSDCRDHAQEAFPIRGNMIDYTSLLEAVPQAQPSAPSTARASSMPAALVPFQGRAQRLSEDS